MTDPRVDAYIATAPAFARPILQHLRRMVHEVCPEVTETIKWGAPTFEYKGMLCGMAAFKAHCRFGFWKGNLVLGKGADDGEGAGQFNQIRALTDLPSKSILAGYIRKAAALNEQGVKAPARLEPPAKPFVVPAPFRSALKTHPKARAEFDAFSPSHKREYAEWIAEAKTEETRERRIATALEWIAHGKARNWKYEKR